MELVTQTDTCYPIDVTVDIAILKVACERLIQDLVGDDWKEKTSNRPFMTINLTHPKGVEKRDRYWKYNGSHEAIKDIIDESEFTETPEAVQRSYIGQTMQRIKDRHSRIIKKPFVGRCQLIWVNKNACYPLHNDYHTPHRYHVPIWTHPDVWWVFRYQKDIQLMHMPADGRAWYLDPIQHEHSVINLSDQPRCHLLMTSSI